MNKYGIIKVIKIILLTSIAIVFFGYIVQGLWNWLLPEIIGVSRITFIQALGLLVLSRLLFGGFGTYSKGGKGRQWKMQMKEKYNSMTDEEKEKFRAKFSRYCGQYDFEKQKDQSEESQ